MSSPGHASGRRRALLPFLIAIALAGPLSVAVLIFVFAVDVPVEDQWSHLQDLDRYLDGDMTFTHWVAPHREHRLLVPRLIWFPLARASGWNLRLEGATGYLAALFTFALLASWTWRQSSNSSQSSEVRWSLVAIVSLTLFGWQQWENWLWGAQVQTFACVLFVVAGLLALTSERLGWGAFSVAAVAATLALYSQATGFVFLGLGVLLLLARAWRQGAGSMSGRRADGRWLFLVLWVVLSIGHLLLYRAGEVSESARVAAALEQPLAWLGYTLVFLGSPLVGYGKAIHPYGPIGLGVLAGVVGVTLFVWAVVGRLRSPGGFRQGSFLGGLGGFAIGVALLTGLGRVTEGVGQAYASRYTSYSLLLWLALLLLLALRREPLGAQSAVGGFHRTRMRWLAVGICFALLLSSLGSLPLYRRVHSFLAEERASLGQVPSDLNPDQWLIDQGLVILRKHRLSVFRDQ